MPSEPLTVLVCGSRDWRDASMIRFALGLLGAKYGKVKVLHGAARGADQIAGQVADTFGFEVEEFPADWRGKGKRAGIIRNLEMLDQKPHVVLAFQINGSTGTQHTIDEARRRGIQTFVYHPPGSVLRCAAGVESSYEIGAATLERPTPRHQEDWS